MARFSKQQIKQQIAEHYPACPEFAIDRVTELVLARDWWDLSALGAVTMVIQSVLRHNMTEYERLLHDGVARDEARRRVQWKVDRMISEWMKRPTE